VVATDVTTPARHRPLLFAIFTFWLVGLIDKFAFSTILTDRAFLTELGLVGHATAIGALVSIAVFTQALGNAVFGWAVDRYGPRRCALVGSCGWVLSCALAALAHALPLLVVSRFLLGLCEGYTWPVGNALTARWFEPRRRARARGLWMSAVCVGPGLSGFLTAGLLGTFSWRGVFWCLALGSAALCVPLVLLFVRDTPPGAPIPPAAAPAAPVGTGEPGGGTAGPGGSDEPGGGTAGPGGSGERGGGAAGTGRFAALRTGRFWLATLAASGTTVAVWALAAWLPSYLVGYRHTPLRAFQLYVLTAYGIGLVTMLGYSHLVDRLRRRARWLAASLWTCAGLLLVVGLVPSAPYLLLIAATIAIIYGITLLLAQGFQDQMTPVGRVGTENGLMNAVSNVLASVVPFAMGGLIEASGGSFASAFVFLFTLLAACGGGAFALHRRGY